MKKKILSLLMVAALAVTGLTACGGKDNKSGSDSDVKIAMITDSGDITDMSFNQTTYEAADKFGKDHDIDFKYYKPTENSDEARIASFQNAVADGYNVIVVPGYLFAPMIVNVADTNPDVKIIALDVSEFDITDAAEKANKKDYKMPSNVCCFTYSEELAGYMAGYAVVKEGYTKLGFLGGVAVPAVIRYGYGYIQGANAAAVELKKTADVQINYVYGGAFAGDPAITAVMDTWYKGGTEIVFACGGGIYTSACEAAKAANGKVVGVDTDQSGVIKDSYGVDDLCVTSAMKGLAATVTATLQGVLDGKWDSDYAGKFSNLGLVSGDDPSLNYVQLPTENWQMKNFSVDDYKALVAAMYNGDVKVSNDTENAPATEIKVEYFANIK